MASLSVIMIVKDEADWLQACLDSVMPIADEIIVGDTGSKDGTVAIAESCGARVLSIPWTNDFSAARNATISEATGDWLLHMDADEALDASGAEAIRALVDSDTDADAVELILANYSNDMHAWRWVPADPHNPMSRDYAGYLPVGLLRLFRGDRGFEYRESVHENITASVLEQNGKIRRTDIVIHHYGYACDPAIRTRKAKFYFELARAKRAAHPADLKCLHDVAEQAMACGAVAEAESACRDALRINPTHVETATVLANILLGREEVEEAYALLCHLEKEGGHPAHLQVMLGMIALYRGQWEEAETRFNRVREITSVAPLATLCLARLCDYRGDGERAYALMAALVRVAPQLQEAKQRLKSHQLRRAGEAAFVSGDTDSALRSLVQALTLDPDDALTHNDVGVLMHNLGDRARAQASFERALKLAPALEDAQVNLARLHSESP